MGGQCQCCGYDTCDEALDLHHIDPSQKEIGFGKLRANPIAITKMVDELQKCVLLCANCHREYHAGIRQLPDVFARLNEDIFLSKGKSL